MTSDDDFKGYRDPTRALIVDFLQGVAHGDKTDPTALLEDQENLVRLHGAATKRF